MRHDLLTKHRQWYLWGYAITFSNWPTSKTFWGGVDGLGLSNTLLRPVPALQDNVREGPFMPEILYVLFEGMFASFTWVACIHLTGYDGQKLTVSL